jgi:excisionase family DNA binding protein
VNTETNLFDAIRALSDKIDALREEITANKTPERPRVEPYTVKEFADLIRRHREWVSDRCRAGRIKTMPGKPYRIPVSEVEKWLAGPK